MFDKISHPLDAKIRTLIKSLDSQPHHLEGRQWIDHFLGMAFSRPNNVAK